MNNKGKLQCKDKFGNKFLVDMSDPRYLSGELVPFSKGLITVKDKNGNYFSVEKNDPRYLSGELVHMSKGKVVVKDFYDNKFVIEKTDPRYLSGELVFVSCGLIDVIYKDKIFKCKRNDPNVLNGVYKKVKGKKNKFIHKQTGEIILMYKEDPRFLSGDYEKILKHIVYVKDNFGNNMGVLKTDERLKTGELNMIKSKHFTNCNIHGKQLILDQKRKREAQIPEKYKIYCPKCISYYLSDSYEPTLEDKNELKQFLEEFKFISSNQQTEKYFIKNLSKFYSYKLYRNLFYS